MYLQRAVLMPSGQFMKRIGYWTNVKSQIVSFFQNVYPCLQLLAVYSVLWFYIQICCCIFNFVTLYSNLWLYIQHCDFAFCLFTYLWLYTYSTLWLCKQLCENSQGVNLKVLECIAKFNISVVLLLLTMSSYTPVSHWVLTIIIDYL